jgi:hypothetical protein
VAFEDLPNIMRDHPVACEIWRHEDRARTQAFRAYCRHGRMHAEAPGFVRSSTDHRTFRLPGYNDRLATEIRVVPLLDRSIKRVHVDMNNFSHNLLVTILILAQGQL